MLRTDRATIHDRRFLFEVYASTRRHELAAAGWCREQQDAFLSAQFEIRLRSYQVQFPNSEYQVVFLNLQPVGYLCVNWGPGEVRIVDIALLPEHRGKGIGTALLLKIQARAARSGVPVRLHVANGNAARRLYERLGFSAVEERGMHVAMEWRPYPPAESRTAVACSEKG